jgi:hypothetical protein
MSIQMWKTCLFKKKKKIYIYINIVICTFVQNIGIFNKAWMKIGESKTVSYWLQLKNFKNYIVIILLIIINYNSKIIINNIQTKNNVMSHIIIIIIIKKKRREVVPHTGPWSRSLSLSRSSLRCLSRSRSLKTTFKLLLKYRKLCK